MDLNQLIIFLERFYLNYGVLIVFVANFIEISPFGWMIPGGTLLSIGGFYAFGRPLYLVAIIIFGWFGAWTTFIISYFVGTKFEEKFAERLKQSKRASQAEQLLEKHGPVILTTSMLASLTRFWVAFAAGAKKYNFTKFLIYSGIASLTYTTLMIFIGYIAGSEREKLQRGLASLSIISWIAVFVVILIIYLKIRKEFIKIQEQ